MDMVAFPIPIKKFLNLSVLIVYIAAGFITYANSFSNGFGHDDKAVLATHQANLKDIGGVLKVKRAYFRPVVQLVLPVF